MNAYQKIIIYYFSGTGNSLNVARWFSHVAIEKNIDCQLINIANIARRNIAQPDPDALIAFVSPVHGFNYPPIMFHFIMHFPKGKNKILLLNTRAGMLIGKWVTPGLSGITFYLASLMLMLKGFSIKAMFPVDLPSNWISVHPGLNARTVQFIHHKNKERVRAFANKVLMGESYFKSVREIAQDILIVPISMAYYFAGRFFLSKTYYASSNCTHCDLCVQECPVKAIIKVDNRPFWTYNCESCMKCMGNCPQKAIETGHGFVALFVWLFSALFMVLFYKYFELLFFKIENSILQFAIETILMLSFLALWYRLIHYLLRFKFFERIVVYTSLTKYKFWGRRYKALKNS